MTRVCLVGENDCSLQYELLSRETARDALTAYDIREPFANAIAVETVSLGAAVALLNDLDWYLIRFVSEALVLEPSVSEDEWLSRDLATAIRNDTVDPAETGRLLKIFGLVPPAAVDAQTGPGDGAGVQTLDGSESETDDTARGQELHAAQQADAADSDQDDITSPAERRSPPALVDPMLVARTGDHVPEYDLREVPDTLVVRVTEAEFEG